MWGGLELSGLDGLELLRSVGLDGMVDHVAGLAGTTEWSKNAVNMPVAFAMNEALEVARFPFVVATTPMIKRNWDAMGSKARSAYT